MANSSCLFFSNAAFRWRNEKRVRAGRTVRRHVERARPGQNSPVPTHLGPIDGHVKQRAHSHPTSSRVSPVVSDWRVGGRAQRIATGLSNICCVLPNPKKSRWPKAASSRCLQLLRARDFSNESAHCEVTCRKRLSTWTCYTVSAACHTASS